LYLLYHAAANDASHNSVERYPPPRCHPETRIGILDDLREWASSDDPQSRVLWLHGQAGASKSAVAQSFCQRAETDGNLGGSFFFKRGNPSRGNGNRLFPSLAYQLAVLVPDLRRAISQCVEKDPAIVDKCMSLQLQKLIIEPARELGSNRMLVIVIDGLDECDGQGAQREILRLIDVTVRQHRIPFQFLIASRPEPHIRDAFDGPLDEICRPLNINQSYEDVGKYLRDEFARIHTEHDTMSAVSAPWPSEDVVERLVDNSSGYFIYASTVIKFVDDEDARPTKRLDVIMGIAEPDLESPFAALDQLYTEILSTIPTRPHLLRILAVITHLELPVRSMERLLGLQPGDVRLALRRLQSVIQLPSVHRDDDKGTEVTTESIVLTHHASFLDFLEDPARSGAFHVGDSLRSNLAEDILKALSCTPDQPSGAW
jgi:hypothetical protein